MLQPAAAAVSSGGRWASHQTGGAARLLSGPSQARSALLPAPREGEKRRLHFLPPVPHPRRPERGLPTGRGGPRAVRGRPGPERGQARGTRRGRDCFTPPQLRRLADVSRQNDRSHGSWGGGEPGHLRAPPPQRRPSAASERRPSRQRNSLCLEEPAGTSQVVRNRCQHECMNGNWGRRGMACS